MSIIRKALFALRPSMPHEPWEAVDTIIVGLFLIMIATAMALVVGLVVLAYTTAPWMLLVPVGFVLFFLLVHALGKRATRGKG